MKIWKNKRFWQVILLIGCLPFLICLWQGLNGAINGFSILWEAADYGWDGFLCGVIVWSFVYWPTYLVGLMLILVSAFALIYLKHR